jgi:hypothetical protein
MGASLLTDIPVPKAAGLCVPKIRFCNIDGEDHRELAVFEPSNEAIDFHAEADSEFVLGSAASHSYELALGNYSVHTSPASLQAGEQRIAEIKERLQKEGRL